MKLVIFGNGAISKTFQMIHNFNLEVISVDIDEKTKPTYIGNIHDRRLKEKLLNTDDILIDLTNGQDSYNTADWCYQKNINYINADIGVQSRNGKVVSVEVGYDIFLEISKNRKIGSTTLFSQGMNPGMVSVYFNKLLKEYNIDTKEILEVHVSEIDTQICDKTSQKNTIISTWCVDGVFEDGISESCITNKNYWKSKLKIKSKAKENTYWSKNPWYGKFETMLSGNHEEIYEIGKTYDIPVCFSYKPPVQFSEASKNLRSLTGLNKHIMSIDDTISGENIVGIYIVMKNGEEYWCGSNLSIHDAKKLIKRNIQNPILNATAVLTAGGVIAGTYWIIENRDRGYVMPLQMDTDFVLEKIKPFLGKFFLGKLN